MMSAGLIRSQFIFESAPFSSCHAATLLDTSQGLLASWFGGTKEGHPDVCVWTSRFDGPAWSTVEKVADGGEFPCWNPVLFQPRGGPVMLFYKVGPSPAKWWGVRKISHDFGKTWSAAERLPQGILGPAKNKPIQLDDGTIISPCSAEGEGGWHTYFERSTDGGKSFTATPFVEQDAGMKTNQPAILIHSQSTLQAICRTTSGKLAETWSNDAGRTWSKIALTDLPNCNSGVDAVSRGMGFQPMKDTSRDAVGATSSKVVQHGLEAHATAAHFLIYNHSNIEKVRYPLCIAASSDGKLWQAAVELEIDPPGQYSYPATIVGRDGLLHAAYTYKRRSIKHAIIDPAKLELQPLTEFKCPPPGSPTHRADEFQ